MSKVILAMFMSLDGFIEGPDGEFVPPDWSGDLQRYWADDNTDAAGTLLYGRVNFQFNAGFWQGAAADEEQFGGVPRLRPQDEQPAQARLLADACRTPAGTAGS